MDKFINITKLEDGKHVTVSINMTMMPLPQKN